MDRGSLRILVVEDEMTIALLMEDMLTDLGHQVIDLAMRLPRALELAGSSQIDLAILDVNLDGRMSFPVADLLAERGIPFIFATGYGAAGLEEPYRSSRVIKKPFTMTDIETALEDVAA